MYPFQHKISRPPPRVLCAWVWILCLPGLSGLRANPVGEVVQSGTATFERTPDRLTVTTGDQVVIGWDDFSIRQGETTQFVQPSAGSLAINRVMTGNPSRLFGTLQANGRLVLINPNGIVVGGGAVIDTGAFLASTLDADPDGMLNSTSWEFRGDSAAVLENHGTILARSGDLVLISREVRNTGTLSAPVGTVALGAGREVLVSWLPDAERRLFVRPAGLDGRVENRGAIEAARAELEASGGNPYALAVNNEGTIRATGSVTQEGRVYLVAREGNLRHSGSIFARNADGSGGTVRIRGRSVEAGGKIDASSETARGGSIRVEGDSILLKSGAFLTANGRTGGGRIEIGGGLRGLDSAIANADQVTAETGVRLTADAVESGDGGVVVVWAADRMAFAGTVSVRGGAAGGNGGFVEVSGLQSWNFPNWLTGVDVSAPAGTAGTFLIDPNDILIAAGPGAAIGASPANANTLFADSITTFLASGSLIIETTGTGGTGNITVQTGANLTWASANSLTLKADASLTFQSGVTVNGGGALTLQFAQTANGTLTFAEALPAAASLTLSGGSGAGIVAAIVGPDNGATFTITGAAAGSLNDGSRTANFTNIDQLTGGAGDDAFVLSGATVFGGNIAGGGSVNGDTLNFSGATGFAATVDIGDLDPSNRLGTATGIEIFIAPGTGSQALRGSGSVAQAWGIVATGVQAGGVLYQGFETLTGRNVDDTFTFAQGATFAGTITGGGGGGTDVIVLTGPSQSISLSAAGAGIVNGSGTFAGIESLDGGTGGILTGPDSAQTWSVTGSNSGSLLTTAFQNFATLNGGSNVDTFVFGASGSLSGDLNGGGGADIFNLTAGGSVGGTIDGGGGSDSLAGLTTGSNWSITGSTGGAVGLSDFTGIDVLTGGTGNDTFTFGNGAAFAGSIAGGTGGTDEVVLTGAGQAVVLSGAGAGSVNGSGTFSGMESLDGGSSGQLTGPNSAQTWSITGADSGTVLSMAFNHFGTLTGGTAADTFNFGASGSLSGDLNGGNGADVVDLSLGGSVAGTIDGGTGSDSILGAAAGMNWSITGATGGSAGGSVFTGIDVLTGGTGDDVFTFDADAVFSGSITGGAAGSDEIVLTGAGQSIILTAAGAGSVNGVTGTFSGMESLNGGTSGSLTGWNAALAWSITGADSGSVGTTAFQNFSDLSGGSNNDTFTFGTAGTISGTVTGGAAGTDVINLSTDVDVVTITGAGAGSVVDGSAANVVNAFSGIETVQGGATGANTLVNNTNAVAVFNITAADSGTLTTTVPATLVTFGSFGNLTGDDGITDRFVFANGIGLSGAIAGGTGTDILDFGANTTAVTVNLESGSSTQVAGGIGGIETVTGGSAGDDLTGSSTFSSTLQGGGGNDTYRVTFGGAAITTTITEAGGGGTDTVELTGTAGADTFTLTAATTLSDGNHVVSYGANVEGVNLDGLGSTDTLVGFNQANTFNITGSDAGDLGVVQFTSIESLTGGNNNDSFVFTTAGILNGTLDGGSGGTDVVNLSTDVDVVTITGAGAGSVVDGSAANVINAFAGIETINGGATGVNTLVNGTGGDTIFNITGADSGTLTTTVPATLVTFGGFGDLTGAGTFNDTFTFGTAGTISGSLDGGSGGTDVINLSTDVDVVTITGVGAGSVVDGSAANVVNAFSGIETVQGGATGANTLVNGTGGDVIFDVTGANSGTLTTTTPSTLVGFGAFRNLSGGSNNDTFTFGTAGTISGTVAGGAGGTDVINLSTDVDVVTITGAGAGSVVDGGAANVVNSFTGIETINGGATGSNTLVNNTNAAAVFNITAADSGTLTTTVPATLVTFGSFGNLTGDDGIADRFVFANGIGLSGAIAGGTGTDILDFGANTTAVTVNLESGSSTQVAGGIAGIETVIGGSGGDDLTGSSAFSSTLQGGGGNDTYRVTFGGAAVTTTITEAGGGGTDTVELTGTAGADTFTLTTATTMSDGNHAVTYGVNVEGVNLDGLGSTDTLVGFNQANTFNITGSNAGDLGVVQFTSIESLTGGSNNDSFVFGSGSSMSGVVAGGSGTADDLQLSGDNDSVVLTGTGAGSVNSTGSFTGIESIDGGGGSNSLQGPNTAQNWSITGADSGTLLSTGFANFGSLIGGTAADAFVFDDAVTWAGSINGGTGAANTLSFANYTTGVTVNLATSSTAAVTGGFSNIQTVIGGSGGDDLTGSGMFSSTLQGGGGNDTYRVTFGGAVITTTITEAGGGGTDTVELTGTAGADTFTLTGATTMSDGNHAVTYGVNVEGVNLEGLGSADTLAAFNQANTFNITGSNAGDLGVINFIDVESLTGGTNNDTFTFGTAGAIGGTVTGGAAGTDVINLSTDVDVLTITGVGAGSVVDGGAANVVNSFTGIETVNGGATGSNTLVNGTGGDVIFDVSGANSGTLTTTVPANLIAFGGFANLSGLGSFNDTFTFGTAGTISGTVDGGSGGTDVISLSTDADVATITGTGAGSVVDGAAANVINSFTGIETVNGGATGANTLVNGTGGDVIFDVSGANSGTLTTTAPATLVAFGLFGNLTGGASNETFTFGTAGAISGTLTGGAAGADVINLSTDVDVVTITGVGAGSVVDGSAANVVNNFTGIESINGGATGANTLVNGTGGDAIFDVSGANSGTLTTTAPTSLMIFDAFGSLIGGIHNETFVFGTVGTISGTVTGGAAGADVINLSADADVVTITGTGTGSVVDGALANVINSFTGIESINGGAGSNSLQGPNSAQNWIINGSNSGTLLSTGFANFGSLIGGTAADAFVFDDAVTWAGSINGGTGAANTLSFANYTTGVTVNLATSSSAAVTGGFSNIQTVIGGSAADDLTGSSAFSSTLQGGGGGDTYRVTFGGAAITTTITEAGGGGTDTVELTGTAGADTFTLTGATTMSDGNHAVTYGVNVEVVNLDGLGSADTLAAFNQANTFNITGSNAGDLGVINFIDVESLTGGTNSDTFTFGTAGTIGGTVTGGAAGTDVINLSTDVDVVTITGVGAGSVVDGGAANVVNSFTGIETVNGGATGSNTLVNGTGGDVIFDVSGANSGTLTTTAPATLVAFGAFGNLTGGASNETFTFGTAGTISGTVTGGAAGADVINLSTDADVVTITGTGAGSVADGSLANVIGGFTGIETVNGGITGSNTLVNNTGAAAVFNVTGANSGNLTTTAPATLVAFGGFGNLSGQGGFDDTFIFGTAGTISGTVDGGSGSADVINLSTDVDVVTITGVGAGSVVDGSSANVINSFAGIETINGGATGANTLTNNTGAAAVFNVTGANSGTLTTAVPTNLVAFGGFGNLNGGGNTDTFVFSAAGSLAGDLKGGGGADVYDFSAGGQVGGQVNDVTGQSELYGTITAGSVVLGAIQLNSNTVLNTSAANGSVQLGAVAGNGRSLNVTTGSGLKTFQGTVADLNGGSLSALVLAGSGTAEFLSDVGTAAGGIDASSAGGVIFRGGVALGNGSAGSSFAGLVRFLGVTSTTFSGFDGLAFSGGVNISGGDLTINSQGSNLDIASLDAGGRSVTLNAGAGTLDSLGGNMTNLNQLNLTAAMAKLASVTGTGNQTYHGGLRVTGTLTAPSLEFAGSGNVASGDGVSAASVATNTILLDKSGAGTLVLKNDRALSLSANSSFGSLDLEVLSGNLNISSGLQGSSRIGLVVGAGNLAQSTGVLAAPVVVLDVSGNAGTSLAPIRTSAGTSLALNLDGNAFLVEDSRTRLGTDIIYTGAAAAQTVDLSLTAGNASLNGNFGNTGDDFIIRVPAGSLLQVAGRFSADDLRVIASGAIGTQASPFLTQAHTLDLSSGGSGGTFISEGDSVSYAGNAATGPIRLVADGTLTISGDVTTTGNVLLRSQNGNIAGSTTTFPVISAGTLDLEAPLGGIVFNNLTLLLSQGSSTSGNAVTLGEITVTGNFSVSSGGSVTQSGALDVGGVMTVNAPGQSVVLNNTGNQFGSIFIRGASAVVAEADSMLVDLLDTTGSASLISGGAISQAGTITAASLILSAVQGILLENTNNLVAALGNVVRGGEFKFFTRSVNLDIIGNMTGGLITNGVEIRGAGNITFQPGARIAASGLGNDIRIAALAGTFTDSSASAFSLDPLAGSRFVIYSGTRAQTNTGLLTVNFVQLSSPYPTAPSGSGNAVLLREGVPGDTTIVIVTPFVPVASIGGISIGDFGMRSVDVGSSGLGLGGGSGGGFGLFSMDANGRSGDIGDHEAEALLVLRKTLQQDMSAAAKDEILQFLADILAGRLDPREVRLPPGLIYQEDSSGNAVIVTPDMVDDFLISLLDPANHQKLMQALALADKK